MKYFKIFAALVVLIVANLFVFGGVSWNRSGVPTGELSLNQCEIASFASWYNAHKSSRYMRLTSVSVEIDKDTVDSILLPDRKLGIAGKRKKRRHYVLVQNGGPQLEDYIKKKRSKRKYKNWTPPDSKLIIIDGGNDPEALRKKYPDYVNTVVMAGYISVRSRNDVRNSGARWIMLDSKISIESQHREVVGEIRRAKKMLDQSARAKRKEIGDSYVRPPCIPTHQITINWGQRYEPWISSIEAIENE